MTSVVPIMTTGFIWLASFGEKSQIGGFTKTTMLLYFLGALVLSNIVTSSIGFDVGQRIKDGALSMYLVRPLSFPQFVFLENFVWRSFRTIIFVPILILLMIVFWQEISSTSLNLGWQFWLAVLLAHLLSFAISFCIGCAAFFLEDISSISSISWMMSFLFSGQMAPISLLPGFFRTLTEVLPFRYIMSFPLEIMLSGSANMGQYLIGLAWLVAFLGLGALMYNKGLRRYSAVGQ